MPQGLLSGGSVCACTQAAGKPDQQSWLAISANAWRKPWDRRVLSAAQGCTRSTVQLQAHVATSWDHMTWPAAVCISVHGWGHQPAHVLRGATDLGFRVQPVPALTAKTLPAVLIYSHVFVKLLCIPVVLFAGLWASGWARGSLWSPSSAPHIRWAQPNSCPTQAVVSCWYHMRARCVGRPIDRHGQAMVQSACRLNAYPRDPPGPCRPL